MGDWNFSKKQCVCVLKKLGFIEVTSRKGRHDKFLSPLKDSHPPFIMIPRHNELHCQREIVKELKKMGGGELLGKFRESL